MQQPPASIHAADSGIAQRDAAAAIEAAEQPAPPHPIPTRALLGLAMVVLFGHAVLIPNLPLGLPLAPSMETRVFTTRSVAVVAAETVVQQPERPVGKATPPRRSAPPATRPENNALLPAGHRSALPLQPPALTVPEPRVDPVDEPPQQPPTEVIAAAQTAPAHADAPQAEIPAPVASEPIQPPTAAGVPPTPGASVTSGQRTLQPRPHTTPAPIRLRFDATARSGATELPGTSTLTWQHDGADYDARMEISKFGINFLVWSSAGRLTTEGLAPRRFSDKRVRAERAAHFDRKLNQIVFSANTPSVALQPGAQDQLSIFVQLAALVAADPKGFPIDSTMTIQTAGARDAEPWVFTVEREEVLDLPAGPVPTLKLVRKPGRDYDQKVEIWLAPELSYLPARIRIAYAKGDFIDQRWISSSPP